MKTCPVCKERSFDDAEVCYGCLHRFSEEDRASAHCEPSKAPERAAPDQREGDPVKSGGFADVCAPAGGCADVRAPTGGCASELVVRIELPGFVTAVEGPRPRAVACAR